MSARVGQAIHRAPLGALGPASRELRCYSGIRAVLGALQGHESATEVHYEWHYECRGGSLKHRLRHGSGRRV